MDTTGAESFSRAILDEIRAERARLRMSQADVAASAGIPTRTYVRYETGQRKINTDQLFAIARGLRLDATELVQRASQAVASGRYAETGGAITARESAEIDDVIEKMHPPRDLPLDETGESGTSATGM